MVAKVFSFDEKHEKDNNGQYLKCYGTVKAICVMSTLIGKLTTRRLLSVFSGLDRHNSLGPSKGYLKPLALQ